MRTNSTIFKLINLNSKRIRSNQAKLDFSYLTSSTPAILDDEEFNDLNESKTRSINFV